MLQSRAKYNKINSIYSMPELSDRILCDGLETNFTSPSGEIQQTGAPDIAAKRVAPCFAFG